MNSVFSDVRTIGDFFRSLKWAWQRATKGYCELDTYGVSDWFLNTLSEMCEYINENRYCYPSALFDEAMAHYGLKSMDDFYGATEKIKSKIEKYGEEKWGEVLSRLAFLLREANEDTCSKVNPYEDEYHRALEEFREKYGEWGEKLLTKEEKAASKKSGRHPEYTEICELYFNEEHNLNAYREKCAKDALEIFSEWFYSLGF